MKKILLLGFVFVLLVGGFYAYKSYNSVPEDIARLVVDFDSVVYVVENGYAPFKFKVTDENRKEYESLKRSLVKDIKEQKRSWQDAVCAYIGWFGDHHFRVEGDEEIYELYKKYGRQYIDYFSLISEYCPDFMSCKVDEDTWLIRVPSFWKTEDWVRESVNEYVASKCPNLIVDIRGNDGGSDKNFSPLLNLLYDGLKKPTDGIVDRLSPLNIKLLKEAGMTDEDFKEYGYPIDDPNAPEYFIRIPDGDILEFDSISISPLPLRAAVIIDNWNASSAEEFLLEIKASNERTRIYGKDNTSGCVDSGNCIYYHPSNKLLSICYPTCYSPRYEKGTCIDPTGIAPDIRIPLPYPDTLTDNIDEWVIWVAGDLKK